MADSFDPGRAIVPLVRLDLSGRPASLLGTGFFVGARPAVVTARHVFLDNPLREGEKYGMAFVRDDGTVGTATINDYLVSDATDIAVFAAGGVPGAVSLRLSRTKMPMNQDVLLYEYSSTTIEDREGQRVVSFLPFTHKGNVLRHYTSTFPEAAPTQVFDTSFPALQGASGAPVLRASDFAVVGMIVANHERHLLPAQVARIEEKGKLLEEIKYFLPTGKAIEGSAIIDYLEQVSAHPHIVE